MTKTIDQGKEEVAKLCHYFATNRQAFLERNEAQVRQSLIDPLFEALGWDLRNAAMIAPQYREVIPEESLDAEGHQRAPDYTFRVGTLPKFYAEAKKCGVNISTDPAPAFQLRRYGWSTKLALSILTDFEELGVYDCTMRPYPSDKASHARIQYFRFDEYPDRWRELWDVFSREAVWSGAFDQYATSNSKRGTSEVDVEFLKDMESWRLALAGNIALRNKDLSSSDDPDDLNSAVQLTIDRVVFLRMAEDRGLEPYAELLKLCERPEIYARFMRDLCRKADEKYNSGLFHFEKESGVSEGPDLITPKLAVDDKVFKPILESLYFEHGSSYHFGVMPVEILGTVYERFLGKVIRLTAGHQAKVEEKPEVRKAGGVYYTPAYIVEYIVKHTVGRQIEGRSPAQLAGYKGKPPFRVLDMACGSGSFLLGAYQRLLDYFLNWYIEHKPENFKKAVYKNPRDGVWRLTIEEKKGILTTHLFGVDIDRQAVEVTKLSLLLKVLEGETDATLSMQRQLFYLERALPNLADNIKCGNSLIGPDYFTGKLIAEPEEMKRVNPFDWKQGFPDAMEAGGFDCIIGNPPYGRDILTDFRDYFATQYATIQYKVDAFVLFIEASIRKLIIGGRLGFIVPNTWVNTERYHNLRSFILAETAVEYVVNLGKDVFRDANIDTLLLFLKKEAAGKATVVDAGDHTLGEARLSKPIRQFSISQGVWKKDPEKRLDIHADPRQRLLFEKMRKVSLALEQIAEVSQGLIPYNTREMSEKNPYLATKHKGRQWKPLLDRGACVARYSICWQGIYVKFGPWLYTANHPRFYENRKILVQRHRNPSLVRRIVACLDEQNFYFKDNMCGIISRAASYDLAYVLGMLNSSLLNEYYKRNYTEVSLNPTYLRKLPIRRIDFSKPADKTAHDRMVKVVHSMLGLHAQLATVKSEAQKAVIQRQIDATDAEIDRLVYDLYGLTAEEIALVEGTSG
jgi:hypothetical protein